MKKEILYPCFLRVVEYIQEQECGSYMWTYIFEDLAHGICPYGVSIHRGTIYCNLKGKELSYAFQHQPAQEIAAHLIKYFKHTMVLPMTAEYICLRENMQKVLELSCSWKDIRQKSIRTTLLAQYVLALASTYQFTLAEARQLIRFYATGFTLKYITHDHVKYDALLHRIETIRLPSDYSLPTIYLKRMNPSSSNENIE